MKPIILASGNVVPALSEQREWLELRCGIRFHDIPISKWVRANRITRLRKWDISNSGESRFIQHGIPKKKRKLSLNRDEKTRDYRRSENGNWYGKRKGYSFNQADRADRRQTKQLIKQERYDSLFSVREPANWWDFD